MSRERETWRALPDGAGTTLAIAGDIAVAATIGDLTVWVGNERTLRVAAEQQNPARPRIVGDRVLWGPYVVDAGRRRHRVVKEGKPLIEGYVQTAHAWSPTGAAAVVAGRRIAPVGSYSGPMAVARLLDADGNPGAELWAADDVPPGALWFGEDAIVVGTRSPEVFDTAGRKLRTLAGDTSPLRIEGAGDQVLVVESARLAAWRLSDGALVGEARGLWVDADITEDGRFVVSAGFSGVISVHRVAEGLPVIAEVEADAAATGVSVGDGQVIASFADMPAIRKAALPSLNRA